METTEELIKAIQLASDSGSMWMPITTITVVFSIVISLLLYIWKVTQRTSDKRHTDNEGMIKEMSKTLNTMSKLLVKFETKQDNQGKDIDRLIQEK